MKKVMNTKHSSIKQMESMAHNLREKYEVYCSIEHNISVDAHIHLKDEVTVREYYHFYMAPKSEHILSWKELLKHYHKVIGQ